MKTYTFYHGDGVRGRIPEFHKIENCTREDVWQYFKEYSEDDVTVFIQVNDKNGKEVYEWMPENPYWAQRNFGYTWQFDAEFIGRLCVDENGRVVY